jgi:hypothetical protein
MYAIVKKVVDDLGPDRGSMLGELEEALQQPPQHNSVCAQNSESRIQNSECFFTAPLEAAPE